MNLERDNRFSLLRGIACIAIVILHTTYIGVNTFGDGCTDVQIIGSNIARNLMLFAVPAFLMVTGALMLDPKKNIELKKLFSKYIRRVFLALLVFCVLYQVFDSWLIDGNLGIASLIKGLEETIKGSSWSTIWYLYLLIAVYLFLPFYRMIAAAMDERMLKYLLALFVLFMSLIPILGLWKIKIGFYILSLNIYPFYLFFGYGVYSGKLKVRKSLGWAAFVLGSALTVVLTYIRWTKGIESFEMFRDYNAINVILQATGLFVAFFGEGGKGNSYWLSVGFGAVNSQGSNSGPVSSPGYGPWWKVIDNLDENSFGIYLVHIMIVKWVFRVIKLNPYDNASWLIYIALVLGILFSSWLITYLLRKVKPLRVFL